MIYHVTTQALWETAKIKGYYEVASLQTEGFIHMSTESQVSGVLDRYYKGMNDLLILHIDETKLTSPLKYELSPSIQEEFPHVFGVINLEAVEKVESIDAG